MQFAGRQITLRLRPLKRHRRLCAALACSPAIALLSGCQAVVESPSASQVRIVQASPDAPSLDMYANNTVLAYNLGFGYATSYVPLNSGIYTISANTAGSRQVLAAAKNTFQNSTQYTVLLGNFAADLHELVVPDQSRPAPSGEISLRLIHEATRTGAIDVYLVPSGQKLTSVAPLLTKLSVATITPYLTVPTGSYTLVIVPAGILPTSTRSRTYTGPQITYVSGSATTIILIDQQPDSAPSLQVISTPDFVPPANPG